jgi:hypothetical protein
MHLEEGSNGGNTCERGKTDGILVCRTGESDWAASRLCWVDLASARGHTCAVDRGNGASRGNGVPWFIRASDRGNWAAGCNDRLDGTA